MNDLRLLMSDRRRFTALHTYAVATFARCVHEFPTTLSLLIDSTYIILARREMPTTKLSIRLYYEHDLSIALSQTIHGVSIKISNRPVVRCLIPD